MIGRVEGTQWRVLNPCPAGQCLTDPSSPALCVLIQAVLQPGSALLLQTRGCDSADGQTGKGCEGAEGRVCLPLPHSEGVYPSDKCHGPFITAALAEDRVALNGSSLPHKV